MNRFTLVRLATLKEARTRVAEAPEDRVYRAGGIDLLDHLKEGLADPSQLVELRAVAGDEGRAMRGIAKSDGGWKIGALVTLGQLAGFQDLPRAYAALPSAAGEAATPGIRNAATVGGNLLQRPRCWYYRHSDMLCLKKGGGECLALTGDNRFNAILGGGPSFIVHPSSVATPLVALQAKVTIVGEAGARTIGIEELFAPPTVDPKREHTLAPGEVLVNVELPPELPGQRSAYRFAKEKQSHDWPLGEAAVRLSVDDGKLHDVRVALGHVAPIPWRSPEAEKVLEGQAPTADLFEQAAEAALGRAKPLARNAYKIPLTKGLLRQALHAAASVPLPE
jgi:xanthine dehydrogenase YagS FAD-binding subunit